MTESSGNAEKKVKKKLAAGIEQELIGSQELGDFTTTSRLLPISVLAIAIGAIGAFLALGLLRLIGLCTNLFFFQRWNTEMTSPANHHLGYWVWVVPVVGGLMVGAMARWGSERIRGHGIPEALESILLRGARIEPKVALLKPISAAISIGSGGPFGAEGPIIMTAGAVGSLISQFFHLSDTERKTLLVAGAAAGMSATFATPIAAVFLAVELLLFELKPRSLVPVALASATAAAARRYLLGAGPLFFRTPHSSGFSVETLLACGLLGLLAGLLSMGLTKAVYASEDLFGKLPVHWMWWPAIGGLGIGIGGMIFPQALGVGYDVIGVLLTGQATTYLILGILIVKAGIWSFSLGSGTSGGVLAPLLMMGGALGAGCAHALPFVFHAEGIGFWPLIAMAATLGGTMRSPLTATIFALELTSDVNVLLPLLIGAVVAHGFTVLTLRRSILTEKLSRRGFHLSREYSVDPLEIMFAREVMRTKIVALPESIRLRDLRESMKTTQPVNAGEAQQEHYGQWLYPVVKADQSLLGVMTRHELESLLSHPPSESESARVAIPFIPPNGIGGGESGEAERQSYSGDTRLADVAALQRKPAVAYPDEPLRVVVYRMAKTGFTRLPVVERRARGSREGGSDSQRGSGSSAAKVVGMISLKDLLKARVVSLNAEHDRERVLPVKIFFPSRFRKAKPVP